jgi:hypothetical protein
MPQVLPQVLLQSYGGLHKRAPSGVTTGKKPLMLEPVTEEAMHSALDGLRPFPDVSRSTTAGYLPHSALEPCRVEITTVAS